MIRLVALAICLLATNAIAAAPAVKAEITFSGLWWSEQQVVGLDPNHPPPMTTRATLDQWNAEDNQWPPHPDILDVDVTLTGTPPAVQVPVQIGYQWYEKGHLTPLKTIKQDVVTFGAGADQSLHASVNVGAYLQQEHLPKRLRVVVKIASQPPIVRELPFVVGD